MKVNSDKSHLLMSGNKVIENIDDNRMESKYMHKFLGITIDSKMTLENQFLIICPLIKER